MATVLPAQPAEQPKRILALDGGGVRGVIAIAFLERAEELLRAHAPDSADIRLADHFDLIGGTSTGAVIATALALGMSAAEIKTFYFDLAPRVFRRAWRVPMVQARFDSLPLEQELVRVIGDRQLDTPDLRTALAIVVKRIDTGSAWIVTNNSRSKYWNDAPDASYIGNRRYRLAALVRASTAAPFYFAPQSIEIAAGQLPGLFIDGGITPHNNPALALLQAATIPAYGFGWRTGADQLSVLSIGTGRFRVRVNPLEAPRMTAAKFAFNALTSMICDAGEQTLTMMQLLGRSDAPWAINSELGDLRGVTLGAEPLFTFHRYDARLERAWLANELGIALTEKQVLRLREMDRHENVGPAYEIGRAAAEKLVDATHFGAPRQRVIPAA